MNIFMHFPGFSNERQRINADFKKMSSHRIVREKKRRYLISPDYCPNIPAIDCFLKSSPLVAVDDPDFMDVD